MSDEQEASAGASEAIWLDSHCHLQDCDDVAAMLGRAVQAGVRYEVCVGTNLAASRAAVQIASDAAGSGEKVWSTIGLHPHEAKDGVDALEAYVEEIFAKASDRSSSPPGATVAIGECGLDYYYEHSPRDVQLEVFARQIRLAHRFGAALVVHTRDAWDDTFAVLHREGVPEHTIIHCFSGGAEEARQCLDLGTCLSFSGILTFKNAHAVREAASICPLDRILVETDSPFLAPVPHRGRPNEPAYVALVGAALAELRGMDPRELAAITTANARATFGLEL